MKTKSIQHLTVLTITMVLLLNSCKQEQKPPREIKEPTQAISYKIANILEEEFKSTRGDTINKYLGIRDTREFWFALDSLKKYIEYVEHKANKLGYKNLGIRIYKGAYPKDNAYPDPGYSTVFLMPTGTKTTSKASFISVNMVEDENISEISPLNYAHAGRPPKEVE